MPRYLIAGLLSAMIAATCLAAEPAGMVGEPGGDLREQIAALERRKLEILRRLALICEERGEKKRADVYFYQIFLLDPSDAAMGVELWEQMRPNKRYAEMIPILERLIEAHPSRREDFLLGLVTCHLKAGNPNRALKLLDLYGTDYITWAKEHIALAKLLIEHGYLQEARSVLERAIKKSCKHEGEAYEQLGIIYAELHETEKAIKAFETALEWGLSGGDTVGCYIHLIALYEEVGSLDDYVQWVVAGLLKDPPDEDHNWRADTILRALASTGEDKYSDLLIPLLDHPSQATARRVVVAMGNGVNTSYLPPLLLRALESDRPCVAYPALEVITRFRDTPRDAEKHRVLRNIFENGDDGRKFHAAFALMHDYQDKEATAYILAQLQSEDHRRRMQAIFWIGDACNKGKAAYPELIEGLGPHLTAEKAETRRSATRALATYSGEEVIRRLVRALGDSERIVALEARECILSQSDKAMVIRALTEALETVEDDTVRNSIQEMLKQVQQEQSQTSEGQ